jgi:PKD repeat protein
MRPLTTPLPLGRPRGAFRARLALGALALSPLLGACGDPTSTASVHTFEASSPTLRAGEALRFSWRTTGARACTLEITRLEGEQPALLEATYRPENCAQGHLDHRAAEPGRFEATFSAYGRAGERTERRVAFEVGAADDLEAPTASFRVLPGDAPLSFVFEAENTATENTVSWEFGDGNTAQGARAEHRYAAPGDYTVTLTVEGPGGRATSSQPLTARSERIVLFDGTDLNAWERVEGGEANWPLVGDAFEVLPGGRVSENNLRTKETFDDFRLHLEFWVPATPEGTPAQARGNSGVYLQGRYEVQILDSYGVTLSDADDAGAIYGVRDADVNASLPPETWQRFDITFRAARFEGGSKVENARVSVRWNGVLVHDDVEIPRHTLLGDPEGPEAGPIVLQDHGSRVRFRNVWLEPL